VESTPFMNVESTAFWTGEHLSSSNILALVTMSRRCPNLRWAPPKTPFLFLFLFIFNTWIDSTPFFFLKPGVYSKK